MPILSNQETRGFTHTYKLNYLDAIALGSSAKAIASIPAGGIVTNAALVVNTASAGASDLTVGVGITTTPTNFIVNTTDLDALTKVVFNTGTALDTEPGYVNNTVDPVTVYIKFGGTVANLTAGDWSVALEILDPAGLGSNA
jgi:hypothetical protein